MDPKPLPHNILFTIPRTASHLLTKLLNLPAQPSIHRTSNGEDGYLFLPAVAQRFQNDLFGKKIEDWTDEQTKGLQDALQQGFEAWTSLISSAEKDGKATFIKEHINWLVDPVSEARFLGYPIPPSRPKLIAITSPWSYTAPQQKGLENIQSPELNPTSLPSAFLLDNVKPTFLIRTPFLTFPSSLRTSLSDQPLEAVLREEYAQRWECTYHWTRSLYRFYLANASPASRQSRIDDVEYPLVIDAADLGDEELVRKYARAVGLDEEAVRFEWAAASEEEVGAADKTKNKMTKSIRASKGVRKEMLGTERVWDFEEEKGKWVDEFGGVLAERLAGLVEGALVDYEELRKVRLRV
ncbi:hypothetical protein CC80DRAFT_240234 [Byssothecium circinans]|uniref:P-loop containing nucleoside triphosphate hydrolase protein n=1 Tax=Byssothecium circinans TaxID=147558 RepID=A0A6A5THS2_9PLEO|nr:hypothetical protein CC80DRAFT_240234 [Byssothecium circinans]